ncbi:uncharacterized protein LOC100490653 isoform X2 [Xenopus tropicalis]|uniref:Uncharacterized protein LOC100490653 isoform X2 n=1 Tax=Xenopus tropicalis TaxID=8364 RepID=A0A8J1JUT7_XENTR|nr:uncharacterized protein LOC100490653 isoform X2 [Xenopus tropicalis]
MVKLGCWDTGKKPGGLRWPRLNPCRPAIGVPPLTHFYLRLLRVGSWGLLQECILAFVIALGILVTTCNAACFSLLPHLGETNGCLYKGELYESGSKFRTKDCYNCTCLMDGSIKCCQAGVPLV